MQLSERSTANALDHLMPSGLNSGDIKGESPIASLTFRVSGMRCAGCVRVVEQRLRQHPAVQAAVVNLVTEIAAVEVAANPREHEAIGEQLAAALTDAGFLTTMVRSRSAANRLDEAATIAQTQQARQQIGQLLTAGGLLVASGIGHFFQPDHPHSGMAATTLAFDSPLHFLTGIGFHWGLATLALLGPGRTLLVEGWQAMRRLAPNMSSLVSLGTLTAYLTSTIALLWPNLGWECFFDEPVMIIGFILLGRSLEQQARHRAAQAFRSLLALQPQLAHLLPDPQQLQWVTDVDVEEIPVGAWVRVLPGERIPVDGMIQVGQTTIDESMLTGESLAVLRQPGDAVSAGTLNQTGTIVLQTTCTGQQTTLAQMIALVEAAQTRKAPIQRLADTIAGYFTLIVLICALVTLLFWSIIAPRVAPEWLTADMAATPLLLALKLAISVLVVACPCALGLATPTALLVGFGLAAEQGLLIRGGDVLERVNQIDTIIFDKTGTLTQGRPTLTACQVFTEAGSLTPESLLQLAASVEQGTHHPLALAIRGAAEQRGLPLLPAAAFVTEPGLGIAAQVQGQLVRLGSQTWMLALGFTIAPEIEQQATAFAQAGQTVVYLAMADQVMGLLAVADLPRPEAAQTIAHLRQLGLQVRLLTGDRWEVAHAVGKVLQLAPSEIEANAGPIAKAASITDRQSQGHQVMMVGDGINDVLALSQAHVSMALRSGTESAIESADIVLLHRGQSEPPLICLADIIKAIVLSRQTFQTIRQNLFWALAYNLIGIPVAAGAMLPHFGIVLNPALAAAMMAASSVLVVSNSLLLHHRVGHQRNFT